MKTKQQELQELKEMLDSGLVTDEEILNSAEAEIKRLEAELQTPSKPPKPVPERRQRVKTPAPQRKVAYGWKKKVDLSQLKPVVIHCQHYHLKVTEEIQVGIKGKGSGTRKVTALPGEHLIFDDKGFLVYVMDAGSFAKKCIQKTTIKEHEATLHQTEKVKELEAKVAQLEGENAKLQKEKPSPTPLGEKPAPVAKTKAKKKPSKPKSTSKKKKATAQKTANKAKKALSFEEIEKEINQVRQASNLPANHAKFKKEYKELQQQKDRKAFMNYLKKRLEEGDKLSESQVVKLGVAIRPFLQNLPGAARDTFSKNKKVLAPNYTNLLRWAENPGNYDLQGVDIPKSAKPTVKARKPKKPSVLSLLGIE